MAVAGACGVATEGREEVKRGETCQDDNRDEGVGWGRRVGGEAGPATMTSRALLGKKGRR